MKKKVLDDSEHPLLLVSDKRGRIFEHSSFIASGLSGGDFYPLIREELIPLPEGSKLFYLPERMPVGFDLSGRIHTLVNYFAVGAFLPPGYTRTYLPGYEENGRPAPLPLWPYTAVAWFKGRYHASAIKVAWMKKADPSLHRDEELIPLINERINKNPSNRLLRHLMKCALEYQCFAAKNVFFQRWEAPIPTSPSCNARCIGCLSFQEGECPASQERIRFIPSPEEIADIAIEHLEKAEDAIVSFGQGCEGEPLLQTDTLRKAIELIRKKTLKGIINLNTNGYSPERIRMLSESGLQSIRISLNSPDKERYLAYYRPLNYTFEDVIRSIRISKDSGLFTSINLLVFPGYTDREEEVDKLINLIKETSIDLIQMRNLSIDPYLYMRALKRPSGRAIGIRNLINLLKAEFPQIKIGYFNLPEREIKKEVVIS